MQGHLVRSHVVADDVVYLHIRTIDNLQRIVAGERGVACITAVIVEELHGTCDGVERCSLARHLLIERIVS